MDALDLATPIPKTPVPPEDALDLLLKLSVQQTQLIKSQNHNLLARFELVEQRQTYLYDKLNDFNNCTMGDKQLKRKLRRIKYLIKENPDIQNVKSSLVDIEYTLRDMRSEGEFTVEIEKLREQIAEISEKLTEIADHAQVAAQYADYRQSLEDAKADFLVRQNT